VPGWPPTRQRKGAPMWIREEGPDDIDAICNVLRRAFADAPGEGRLETRTVDTLRLDHALAVSLVADIDGRVAGHVAFPPRDPRATVTPGMCSARWRWTRPTRGAASAAPWSMPACARCRSARPTAAWSWAIRPTTGASASSPIRC